MDYQTLARSVFPIDIDSSTVTPDVMPNSGDIDEFTDELLKAAVAPNEKRRFMWSRPSTEVRSQLGKIVARQEEFDSASEVIAQRLLDKEKQAQKEHQAITDLQHGTLFLLSLRNGTGPAFVIAKVFASKFLDEQYKKHDHGLAYERRILKTCFVQFTDDGELEKVSVTDSNASIAAFWWREFLELEEVTTDDYNTNTAFIAVENVLSRRLKPSYKSDYYQYRNNLITYFNTHKRYTHREMVNSIFGAYTPVGKDLDVTKLKSEVEQLPEKKGFDAQFDIVADIVKKRRRAKIALTDQIELEISDSIDADAIRAAQLRDGTQGVFIKSEPGFEAFRQKQIVSPVLPTIALPEPLKIQVAKQQQQITN